MKLDRVSDFVRSIL